MDLIDELSSKFMADNISEITTSQRSKEKKNYKGIDLFDNSTIEETEEIESSDSMMKITNLMNLQIKKMTK